MIWHLIELIMVVTAMYVRLMWFVQDRPASGSLTKEELKVAVAVWYTRVSEKSEKKSSACTIL